MSKTFLYHLSAGFTVLVWGVTMVSTKLLLREGLSPEEIMLLRFVLAYLFLWLLYPKWHGFGSLREELLFAGMAVTTGSLYFFFENTALVYTTATNVSLICALIPLFTALFIWLVFRDKPLTGKFFAGSVISIIGAALVVLNGDFSFTFKPLGDFLALISIIVWSGYGLLLKLLKGNYNSLFITRKIFFYSIITLAPYFLFVPFDVPAETLLKPVVVGNILFLGIIASSLCYFLWTLSMRKLGVVVTNNYIYFNPLVTIVAAGIVLSEKVTVWVVCGAALIFSGLLLASKLSHPRNYPH